MTWEVRRGDCIDVMRTLPEASVDAIVTDPPYGLGFMGREWDSLPPGLPWAQECLRVLKPGGHLLAFGGTRTYHRLTCAIEDAGFEVRDCLAWLYGSGFPKSLDVSKAIDKAAGAEREVVGRHVQSRQDRKLGSALKGSEDGSLAWQHDLTAPATPDAERWQGWGTALKPAHEPIVLARKPLSGTVAGNVLAHGTGALNVDGCRIGTSKNVPASPCRTDSDKYGSGASITTGEGDGFDPNVGRWPANVLLDSEAAAILDEQTGELPAGVAVRHNKGIVASSNVRYSADDPTATDDVGYGDSGGASRFFYVAKASSAERNAGLDGFEVAQGGSLNVAERGDTRVGRVRSDGAVQRQSQPTPRANVHPTVKPIDLMRWLCRLVTPPGGVVLDPFTGSGTTGCAAVLEGFRFIGIEREAEYADIAEARVRWWAEQPDGIEVDEALAGDSARRKVTETGQLGLC